MISQQYLLSSHVTGHPCNALVNKPLPPRCISRSLNLIKPEIEAYLPSPSIDPLHLKMSCADIHTRTVEDAITRLQPNRVLGEQPPSVAEEEKQLTRGARSRLAQLRIPT